MATLPDGSLHLGPAAAPRSGAWGRLPRAAAGAVILLGGLVLCGWTFDIGALKSVLPGLVEMKANTAIGFILLGISLWNAAARTASRRSRWLADSCAGLAALIGLTVILEYVVGRDLGIDQLLFRDDLSASAFGLPPGRMAFASAANFLALGTALAALRSGRGVVTAQLVTAATGLVAVLSLLGYLFGEKAVYAWSPYTSLALHTAAAFAVFCAGLLSAYPDRGPVALLVSRDLGGYLARRLLPRVIGVSILVGLVVLTGVRAGLYRPEFGVVVFAVLDSVTLGVVVWTTAAVVGRTDLSRRQAEAEARDARAAAERGLVRLRAVVESMTDGLIVSDREGNLLDWNPAALRMHGFASVGEVRRHLSEFATTFVVARPDGPLVPPADWPMARVLRGETLTDTELNVRRPDTGLELTIAFSGAPVYGPGGVIELGVMTLHDVTRRRRAEAELRESEARFRLLVEGVKDYAIFMTDPDGRVVTWNAGAERLKGYTAAEAVGRPVSTFYPPADAAAGKPGQQFDRARAEGRVEDEGWRVRKDGTRFWANVVVTALTDPAGRLRGFAKVTRDITERKQLEEQFRQAQKMEAVGQLAGGVAHDFNNLLTIINGYSDLLLQRIPADDPSRDLLDEIRKAGERSAGLTRQLLAFSRKQIVQPRILDLNALVGETDKLLRRVIGEDITLTVIPDRAAAPVKADPGQLEQVILNLAVNARDAMPRGGALTIRTTNEVLDDGRAGARGGGQAGEYVVLAVTDTGTGMTDEVKKHLFEPFFTTKGVGKGTGLGLAVVHGVVKQSGGLIEVESEVGRGTTFRIYLPRVEAAGGVEKDLSVVRDLPGGTETVLLVEDEEAVRALTRHVLRTAGYTVLEAGTGAEALRAAAGHAGSIHLLVTDVVMPGMGGRELAEQLVRSRPGLSVLYLSGYTDDAVVKHGIMHDAVNFLQKPFSPHLLAHKVREVLDSP